VITPDSVAPGSYALAELGFAKNRWPRPAGYVLPVMIVPTPMASVPPYLAAVTILQPTGEAVAETVAAFAKLKPPPVRRTKVLAKVAALVLALVLAGSYFWTKEKRATENTRVEAQNKLDAQAKLEAQAKAQTLQASQTKAENAANAARQLCDAGSHAEAFVQLTKLVEQP
jgi:uncharacterized protein HemX